LDKSDNEGGEMDVEFSDFKVTVAETNRAFELALECARDVMRKAAEIQPASRSYMIETLVALISDRANNEKRRQDNRDGSSGR
jgi:hypothetical protein